MAADSSNRTWTRRRLAELAIALGLGVGVAPSLGCADKTKAAPTDAALGPAPAFETKDLSGEEVRLADYRGKVVLLNTWATWCDPCVRELPELARLHEQLEHKGFTVIGLNQDVRSKLAAVRTTVAHNELPFPIWLDFDNQAQVAFKLRGYPTSLLIDREGNIRWRREGEIIKNDPELGAVLEQVLAQ